MSNQAPGTLFIVAAPSGAGKSTLVNALLEREPTIRLSISHTTRAPRDGEGAGEHYHFVNRVEFDRLVAADAFLEHAEVHGNCYGTSRAAVEPILATGEDVLLEIDYQGARQIRQRVPGCVGVFILPPSRTELERRLRGRAKDSDDVIARRLANSREEIAHAHEFDYLIVNEQFDRALEELRTVVTAQRLRRAVQLQRHAGLLRALLE